MRFKVIQIPTKKARIRWDGTRTVQSSEKGWELGGVLSRKQTNRQFKEIFSERHKDLLCGCGATMINLFRQFGATTRESLLT